MPRRRLARQLLRRAVTKGSADVRIRLPEIRWPQVRLYAAVVLFVAGVVFAVARLGVPKRGEPPLSPEAQARVDEVRSGLEASRRDLERQVSEQSGADPIVPDDRDGATRVARDVLRDRLRSLAGVPGSDALAKSASERLAIIAFPDFAVYAAGVRRDTGKDVSANAALREVFEKSAAWYSRGRIVWGQLDVRPHVSDPMQAAMAYGISSVSTANAGLYGSPPEGGELTRCVDVVVPLVLPGREASEVPLRVVISYRPRSHGAWAPFLTRVFDPGQGLSILPAPWI